ncbi:hypothetical protein BDD12DRAFT_274767 [Trichophaea hybrida]|nr:hypothetical protein BDD12DRAFT_274767 [Trichophaea hybrida]
MVQFKILGTFCPTAPSIFASPKTPSLGALDDCDASEPWMSDEDEIEHWGRLLNKTELPTNQHLRRYRLQPLCFYWYLQCYIRSLSSDRCLIIEISVFSPAALYRIVPCQKDESRSVEGMREAPDKNRTGDL